ncbi:MULTISPECIES: OmpA family protein [unclassified Campylobacter]|uniref:OmpA family protein n=1 Tax=Campylobacter TaxID=194 RepID=UPI001474C191|nr:MULTISPECIES: OmpA family protein [unclassified Campylobacter]QKF92804.1 Tol-Pal system peptidoglycan-associated lipoprotein [Campylobacter sp. CCUG 57310]
MKKVVLASAVVAALFMSGCSSKNPEVDMSADSNQNMGMMGSSTDTMMSSSDRLQQLLSAIEGQVKTVYFDFDKFNIKSDMQPVVNTNASLFNQSEAQSLTIKVEGNCDEWGTDEYNYALGLKRAKATKDALVKQGVSADRIMVVSYGESNPVCSDKTKACDAQNRRAEFKVLP